MKKVRWIFNISKQLSESSSTRCCFWSAAFYGHRTMERETDKFLNLVSFTFYGHGFWGEPDSFMLSFSLDGIIFHQKVIIRRVLFMI